ncbi:hypothetical protein FF011L_07570 [Roseimaritima multifibrata]|uniref:Uncharacterized protein n=1 Tax=Roseimaritima multifibrata TaxID=1930274 RepID=A0A517MAZ2_9BACT|nr:ribonuclease E inhibitor RraB [Roseimaritima multifibrata]QDS92021.1 hypothetical protein FF011L_07570 [Roseimaritima multifibrata]
MDEEPDVHFDIDALFGHMAADVDYNPEDELDWVFVLRSKDQGALEQVAQDLESDFTIEVQGSVEEIVDGKVTVGDPILTLSRVAAFTADDVKQIAAQVQAIADERSLTYAGVECYEAIDEDELFGWLAPEDAGWRLRGMTEVGLEENAELPWVFLAVAPSLDASTSIASALQEAGFSDRDDYDEADEEGDFAICVFVVGRNNELELDMASQKIAKIAESHGGKLLGVQFYTRDEVADVFGSGEEE